MTTKAIAGTLAAMGLLCTLGFASAPPSARHAIKPAPLIRISTRASVIQGNSQAFQVLGTVDRREVFQAIPAYQTLRHERLDKKEARYHFLLRQANEQFDAALRRISQEMGVDLVVERGEVETSGLDIVDLTGSLVESFAPPKKQR